MVNAGSLTPTYPPDVPTDDKVSVEHVYNRMKMGKGLVEDINPSPDKIMHTLNDLMALAPRVDDTNGATSHDVCFDRKIRSLQGPNFLREIWGEMNFTDEVRTGQDYSFHNGDDGHAQAGAHWPDPRFSDNGDGTVTDHLTRLIWVKNQGLLNASNWADALTDINALKDGVAGLSDGSAAGDWRLPNIRELMSLTEVRQQDPVLPTGHPFEGIQSTNYWTSTTHVVIPQEALIMDLRTGATLRADKTLIQQVWAVRNKRKPPAPEADTSRNLDAPASPFDSASMMYSMTEIDQITGPAPPLQRTNGFVGPTSGPAPTGLTMADLQRNRIERDIDSDSGAIQDAVREGKTYFGIYVDYDANGHMTESGKAGEYWGMQTGTRNPFGVLQTDQKTSYAVGDDGDFKKGVDTHYPYTRTWAEVDNSTVYGKTFHDYSMGFDWLLNSTALSPTHWTAALDRVNALRSWENRFEGSQLGLGGDVDLDDDSKAGEWRLPNKNELFVLVDFDYTEAPFVVRRLYDGKETNYTTGEEATKYAYTNAQSAKYWTSTTCAHDLSKAWAVDFSDGTLHAVDKNESCYIWPVKGGDRDLPPLIEVVPPEQSLYANHPFEFSCAANTFVDPEGDPITYSAMLVNVPEGYTPASTGVPYSYSDTHASPLPDWITFSPEDLTFSGTNELPPDERIVIAIHATQPRGENTVLFMFNSINLPPELDHALLDQYHSANDAFEYIFDFDCFTDVNDGSEGLTYTAMLSNGDPLPDWITFDGGLRRFSGTTPNVASLLISVKVTATDPWGKANDDTFDYVISNDPPQASKDLVNQEFYTDTAFEYIFDSGTFVDPEGDPMTYDATLADGSALPSWITLDGSLRKFSGTTASDFSTLTIKLTATDPFGAEASSEFLFRTVVPAPVYHGLLTDQTAQIGVVWTYVFPENTFTEDVVTPADLTYTAELDTGDDLPDWLSFDGATRTFSGTPPSWSDSFVIEVRARNTKGASTTGDFELRWQ